MFQSLRVTLLFLAAGAAQQQQAGLERAFYTSDGHTDTGYHILYEHEHQNVEY